MSSRNRWGPGAAVHRLRRDLILTVGFSSASFDALPRILHRLRPAHPRESIVAIIKNTETFRPLSSLGDLPGLTLMSPGLFCYRVPADAYFAVNVPDPR